MRRRSCSTLDIDAAWASGPAFDRELEEHLARCAACAAYVRELRGLDGAPLSLSGLRPPERRRSFGVARLPGRGAWALAAAPVVAVAAAVVLYFGAGDGGAPRGYVGVKGEPSVDVLLRRDGATRIWAGREPVRPGDALALHVACDPFEHVIVAARQGEGWAVASRSACPRAPSVLPFSLIVDDASGQEELAVIFSHDDPDEEATRAAIERAAAGPEPRRVSRATWSRRFVFAKEGGR